MHTLFIDNCSSHILNEDVLNEAEAIRTTLRCFPANITELNQPRDSFVIQKLKDSWRKRGDKYEIVLIVSNAWTAVDNRILEALRSKTFCFCHSRRKRTTRQKWADKRWKSDGSLPTFVEHERCVGGTSA